MIPFSDIIWLHANVSGWPRTSRIEQIGFGADWTEIQHTKAGHWPVTQPGTALTEGNPWIVAQVNGRWYAATYEWLKPGQTRKGVHAGNIGAHTKRPPLEGWSPRPGELVGFLVSTLARDAHRTSNERSDLVAVRWGEGTILWREGTLPVPPPSSPSTDDVHAALALIEQAADRLRRWLAAHPEEK